MERRGELCVPQDLQLRHRGMRVNMDDIGMKDGLCKDEYIMFQPVLFFL